MKYTEFTNDFNRTFIIRDNEDGSVTWIPIVLENSDYQAYLASLENGTIS